jgi:flagellar biosynthesis GTPase FlhF
MPEAQVNQGRSPEQELSGRNTDRQAASMAPIELHIDRPLLQDVRKRVDGLVRSARVLNREQLARCREHIAAIVQPGQEIELLDAAVALDFVKASDAARIKRQAWIEAFVVASRAALDSTVSSGVLDPALAAKIKDEQKATFRASGQLVDLIATARARGHLPLVLTPKDDPPPPLLPPLLAPMYNLVAGDRKNSDDDAAATAAKDVPRAVDPKQPDKVAAPPVAPPARPRNLLLQLILRGVRAGLRRTMRDLRRRLGRRRREAIRRALEMECRREIAEMRRMWEAEEEQRQRTAAAAWQAAEAERQQKAKGTWDAGEAARQQTEADAWRKAEQERQAAEQRRREAESKALDGKLAEEFRRSVQTADKRALDDAREKLKDEIARSTALARQKLTEMQDAWVKEEQQRQQQFHYKWMAEEAALHDAAHAACIESVAQLQADRQREFQVDEQDWRSGQRKAWLRDFSPAYHTWSAEWREHVAPHVCAACAKPFDADEVSAYVCARRECSAVYHVKCIAQRLANISPGRSACAGRHAGGPCSSSHLSDFGLVARQRTSQPTAPHPGLTLSPQAIATCNALQARLDNVPSVPGAKPGAKPARGAASAGHLVDLNAPFQPLEVPGPVVISNSLTVHGANVALYALRGPVVVVESGNVTLKDLRLHVTQHPLPAHESERCALVVKPGCTVRLENIEMCGDVIGVPGEEGRWEYPPAIDLGELKPAALIYRKIVEIVAPVDCTATTNVPGIVLSTGRLKPGKNTLQLDLNGNQLAPGGLLHGDISLQTANVRRQIVLTGRVVAGGSNPSAPFRPPVIIPAANQDEAARRSVIGNLVAALAQPRRTSSNRSPARNGQLSWKSLGTS